MDDEFLIADEAARFVKITRGALYNLVAAKEVPFYRLLGRRSLRFKKSDLVKLFKPAQSESNNV